MKRISKYLFAFLSLSLLAVGCVKDDGNYEYNELPIMEASSFAVTANGANLNVSEDNQVFIKQNDEIIISPNYEISDDINVKYTWTLIVGEQIKGDTIVPGKLLGTDAILTHSFDLEPGKYFLILEMLNNAEGQDFKKIITFTLFVETINGIAILHTKDSKGDVSVFKTSEIDDNIPSDLVTMFSNVVSGANSGELLNNPTFIEWDYDAVVKFNIGTSDGVKLFDVKFNSITNDDAKFYYPSAIPTTENPQFMFSHQYQSTKFAVIVNDNKLMSRNAGGFGGSKQLYKFNEDDYFPLTCKNRSSNFATPVIIFNQTAKSFQSLREGPGFPSWNIINIPITIFSTGGEGSVNIGDTGMDVITYGATNKNFVAIMKSGSTIYSALFSFPEKKAFPEFQSSSLNKIDITALQGISESTPWAFGFRGEYAFYGAENNLYVFDPVSGSAFDAGLGIPSGEVINKITVYENEENEDYNGALIFVATVKNGSEGTVYQFKINTLNGRPEVATKKSITGFGEVKDIKVIKPLG